MIADLFQRKQALDTSASYIVQAPAGSGKTELLTRRFLALLARVDNPEEIIAITFTRKAASEMRLRILQLLKEAEGSLSISATDFEKEGFRLASIANIRNKERSWHLLEIPSRLRVQTIDSFCAGIVRQMPILSEIGAVPQVSDNAESLYERATENMLSALLSESEDSPFIEAINCLLSFFDNKVPRLRTLLHEMLATRDQWRRHLPSVSNLPEMKREFECVLQRQVEGQLEALAGLAPDELLPELSKSTKFAAMYFYATGSEEKKIELLKLQEWPDQKWSSLPKWKCIADFLTKKSDGEVKIRVTKNDGFPVGNKVDTQLLGLSVSEIKSSKQAFVTLLSNFGEYNTFINALSHIRYTPESGYSDKQWELMESLAKVLNLAEAYLKIVFSETGQSDYTEVALGADRALGTEDSPTDLALSLDYRIRHLLIDEFQDTSSSQFQLFEKLTAEWDESDGRTFFAVGDPMQSIYRFREAQVGLFIKAREQGISNIQLTPLTLTTNFRSTENIIQWVNSTFSRIFPSKNIKHLGAVTYAPSTAIHESSSTSYVHLHFFKGNSPNTEAQKIADICNDSLRNYPNETIAILIRTKSQAGVIVKALQQSKLMYSAIDIDRLINKQVVKDIMSLLRALIHPADRIHWLAVLRAPWCGLQLDDIYKLLSGHDNIPLWSLINSRDHVSLLSKDARTRLERLSCQLKPFMDARHRNDIAIWLEHIWKKIGGRACINKRADLDAAETCFSAIREFETHTSLLDINALTKMLHEIQAPASNSADSKIQIMSIHKSKGLEFGTVLLPGLNLQALRDKKKLLNWVELAGENNRSDLLLAPLDEAGENEPILRLVMDIEKSKAENELLRLLYVACTRTKKRLHLLAQVEKASSGELKKPSKGSLLEALSPSVQPWPADIVDQVEGGVDSLKNNVQLETYLYRLPNNWQYQSDILPKIPTTDVVTHSQDEAQHLDFMWAGDIARHVGVVVHRQMQRIADGKKYQWDKERIKLQRAFYKQQLSLEGVSSVELDTACDRVVSALCRTLEDEQGRWILSDKHRQACSELALTGLFNGQIVSIVIDRTFVDLDGIRWIIDYKTGIHKGTGRDAFLEKEYERYKSQLERYAVLMNALEERPIMLGLYFPLMGVWRQWSASTNGIS